MAKLMITETVLRDAQQALMAAKMPGEDMKPILPLMDQVGYYSCEVWGGETYEACVTHLGEDPWERLRMIRKLMPNTKLQMLLRGQCLAGRRHYADDVVDYFIKRSVAAGIDIIRLFDPLNDLRNLEFPLSVARGQGAHVQAALAYTESPVHSQGSFLQQATQLEEMGADSLCLKDMSGLLTPYTAYDLVAALKKELDIPIYVHSHNVSGMAPMVLLKAAEAGASGVDTAISPFALGGSHPSTQGIVRAFQGTPYETGVDIDTLRQVRAYFEKLQNTYLADGRMAPEQFRPGGLAAEYGLPAAMFYRIQRRLEEQDKSHLLREVLAQCQQVREDAGYPPLVTPITEIVADQALLNVQGEAPYEEISPGFIRLMKGELGRTPGSVAPDLRARVLGSEKPLHTRPADQLESEIPAMREQLPEKYNEQEEDVLTLIQFPEVAPAYFRQRSHRLYDVDGRHAQEVTQVHPL